MFNSYVSVLKGKNPDHIQYHYHWSHHIQIPTVVGIPVGHPPFVVGHGPILVARRWATGRHITVLICLVAMKKNHPQLSCLSTFDGRSLLMGNVNFWGLFYMYPPSMAFDAPGSGWWWWWWLWWWLWWLKEMIPSSGSMFPSWKWYHQKLS